MMRKLKILLIIALVFVMALPAVAGRRQVKKNVGALLTSARIAMSAHPPRYDEALGYFDTVLVEYGMVPEAYFRKGSIYAEFATREYDIKEKLENFEVMAANFDSLDIACESKDVKKNYKDDCGEFNDIADSIKLAYWGENYNSGVKVIGRVDNEYIPSVKAASTDEETASAQAELDASLDSALTYFKIAHIVRRDEARNFEGLALVYDRMGNYDSSLAYFIKASEANPENVSLLLNIAYSYIQVHDWEKAIEYFKKAVALDPENADILYNIAICYNNIKNYDSAFAYNKKVIQADSTEVSAYLDIGQYFLLKAQGISDSIKHYKQENNDEMAKKYQDMRDDLFDSSVVYFGEAVKLEPENTVALEQYALLKMLLGDYQTAAESFKKLTELEPSVRENWISLGDIYLQMQEFTKAIEPYEKAVELNPNDVDVWVNLEDLYRTQGMPEKAKEAAAKVKELKGGK